MTIGSVQFDSTFWISWGLLVGIFAGFTAMYFGLMHATMRFYATARRLLMPGEPPLSWRTLTPFAVGASVTLSLLGIALWLQEVEDYVWSWNR
jgi:hypothetical protein